MDKHKLAIIVALVTFAAASAVAPAVAMTADEQSKAQLTKGEGLLSAGNFAAAEVELRKVIEEFPSTEWTFWARVRLSECYYHQGRFDGCILEARRVVNLYPSQAPQLAAAWAQVNVGLGYKGKGELDAAIWELEKVESILGNHEDRGPVLKAKYEMALAHHNRNNRAASISLCRAILSDPKATDHDRAFALVVLGSSLIDDWRIDEGLAELQKVRDQYPGLQDAILAAERRILESKYIARHDYDGAIREGRVIIESPAVSEGRARQARYFMALACFRKGDYDSAISEAQTLLDNYPVFGEDHRQCYALKARAYAMKKDYAQAISCLESLLATNPTDPEMRAVAEWDIATCYKALGDSTRANERLQRITSLYPRSHLALRAVQELKKR